MDNLFSTAVGSDGHFQFQILLGVLTPFVTIGIILAPFATISSLANHQRWVAKQLSCSPIKELKIWCRPSKYSIGNFHSASPFSRQDQGTENFEEKDIHQVIVFSHYPISWRCGHKKRQPTKKRLLALDQECIPNERICLVFWGVCTA